MLERLAKIMWQRRIDRCRELGAADDELPWPWDAENETLHDNVRCEVAAVIEALMEPTPEMIEAGSKASEIRPSEAAFAFRAMLRSILSQPTKDRV